jgi:uncharacterized protein (DUF433 family)
MRRHDDTEAVELREDTQAVNAFSPFLGVGVYDVSRAAKLAEVPAARARAWIRGYRRPAQDSGQPVRGKPLLGSRLSDATDDPLVTFADLVEMRFVRHFRSSGFSWKRILAHLPELQRVVLHQHQSGRLTFESDGVTIFARTVAQDSRDDGIQLDDRQLVMMQLLERSFREELRFTTDGTIEGWQPRPQYPHVLIDPNRQFGEPIVEPGVPTSVLAEDLVRFGGDAERVGRRYAVNPEAVIDAHRFETDLKAAA